VPRAAPTRTTEVVLRVSDLVVDIPTRSGTVRAVDGVGFDIRPGEVLGLVGESGSGKSMTALSILHLLPPGARVTGGSIRLGDRDLLAMSAGELRSVRGRRIAMVFQDPLTSLNPLMTVDRQLVEAVRLHDNTVSAGQARHRVSELLATVGFPQPRRILGSYPHELSGGMRQRVMIVMAMANHPDVIIADEPTTALDVTIQAQVLDALQSAREAVGSAMLLISHDLGLIADRADRVHVMYHGRIAEAGPVEAILDSPRHPYTIGLLNSRPSLFQRRRLDPIPGTPPGPHEAVTGCPFAARCARRRARARCVEETPALYPAGDGTVQVACHFAGEAGDAPPPAEHGATAAVPVQPAAPDAAPALQVRGLVKEFGHRRRLLRAATGGVRAVDQVSFEIPAGRTLALVGESGSGKSTAARALLRLIEPTSGQVLFDGTEVTTMPERKLRDFRTRAQLVQQDPYSALNPRMTVGEAIGEALRVHRIVPPGEVTTQVSALLESVGLRREHARRYPHEFSGGQRQRICIARALSVEPDLLVLDEPVSSLDVSIQAQILNLLADLQRQRQLAYLFITHDFAVVRNVADDIAVLYRGRVVEAGPAEAVLAAPAHPYTQALIAAVPDPLRRRRAARGAAEPAEVATASPAAGQQERGCPFRDRCPRAQALCASDTPPLAASTAAAPAQKVACHFPGPAPARQPEGITP